MAYKGIRDEEGNVTVINLETGKEIDPRFDLYNHSPTGFNWGYGGSGPAQLALAILSDYLQNDEKAMRLYQFFKRDCVAGLEEDEWILHNEVIDQQLRSIEQELYQETGLDYTRF